MSRQAVIGACEKGAEWVLPVELEKNGQQCGLAPDVIGCGPQRAAAALLLWFGAWVADT